MNKEINFFEIMENDNHQELRKLIEKKEIHVDELIFQDISLFQLACQFGAFECAKLLIKNGCDINYQEPRSGHCATHIAIRNRKSEIIDLLIEQCANFNIRTNNNYTTAHFAIKFLQDNHLIKKIINLQLEENLTIKADGKYSIEDFLNMYKKEFVLSELVEKMKVNSIDK
jgi:ankyrin repeat protein